MVFIEVLYALCVILLSMYGFNSLALVWLYLRHRKERSDPPPPPVDWPQVTVQLPVYNELYTVERLIKAAASLDYPADRLEVQVLDDSTDDTRQLAARVVERLRGQGIDISHLTRPRRTGFKAGALAYGLARAKGELIAYFDADFVPDPDFLRQVVPYFADAGVGCVQARWGHLNRDYSLFTRVQALGIDGHFVVEQVARSRAGLFLNFNGTAGVWRQSCIADAGGWKGDTLTEDLDLSYRAQLRGWRIAYLPDVVVPAEVPVQIRAYKQQQARWAQGSLQTAIKMIAPLLRSSHPWTVKLGGVIHLTSYLVHPLMLCMALLTPLISFSQSWVMSIAPWLMGAAIGPPLLYAVAQITDSPSWPRRLRDLPLLVLLGMGLSLSNTGAALRALAGSKRGFLRTPKFAVQKAGEAWVQNMYALRADGLLWGEWALSLCTLAMLAMPTVKWSLTPWLLMQAGGYSFVAATGLWQAVQLGRWRARQPKAAARRRAGTRPVVPGEPRADFGDPGR